VEVGLPASISRLVLIDARWMSRMPDQYACCTFL